MVASCSTRSRPRHSAWAEASGDVKASNVPLRFMQASRLDLVAFALIFARVVKSRVLIPVQGQRSRSNAVCIADVNTRAGPDRSMYGSLSALATSQVAAARMHANDRLIPMLSFSLNPNMADNPVSELTTSPSVAVSVRFAKALVAVTGSPSHLLLIFVVDFTAIAGFCDRYRCTKRIAL